MENISIFLRGAEALGVPKYDLFQTVDLFEKKNMTQVIDSIFSLSRYGYKAGTSPNVSKCWRISAKRRYSSILCKKYLGPKLADKQKATYSQDAANAANATFNTYQYGYTGGANQVSGFECLLGGWVRLMTFLCSREWVLASVVILQAVILMLNTNRQSTKTRLSCSIRNIHIWNKDSELLLELFALKRNVKLDLQ